MFTINKIISLRTLKFFGIGLLLLTFSSRPAWPQTDWVVLFQDDFNDGVLDGWSLGPLYGDAEFHIEDEGGNFVLSGSGHGHADAIVDSWKNFHLKLDVKFVEGTGGVHFNHWMSNGRRYFIGFSLDEIYLNKSIQQGNIELESVNDPHEYGRWYKVEIIGLEKNIKIYVDGVIKIDYIDTEPIDWGTFGLETLEDSHIYFDNIIIKGEKPPTLDMKWFRTGGPSGGLGYDVRIHPKDKNIMFVTDNPSGVNKSYDGGDTWVQRNSGITTSAGASGDGIPIFSLTVDPNNTDIVWAGTQNAKGIYKSTDGGETWVKKDNGVIEGDEISFRGFGVHPYNSNIVFAGAEISTGILGKEFDKTKGKIYKTEDGGENWRTVWEGNNLARFVLFDPNNPEVLYASTGIFDREAYNDEGVGILKSIDGGDTWFQINNGIPNSEGNRFVGFLEMHPTESQILFAASGNNARGIGGVFRTTNGGESWEKVLSGDVFTIVTISPSNATVVYAGSADGFYRSDDGGTNWQKFSKPEGGYGPPGIRAGFPISAVVDPDNSYTVFANNYMGGNFKSTDGGRSWVNSSKGYTGADLHDITVDLYNPAIVYTIGRSGPFRSYNGGEDWDGIRFSISCSGEWYAISLNPANPNEVLMSSEFDGTIYKSIDSGNSWKTVFQHPQVGQGGPQKSRHGFKDISYAPSDPTVVYAGMRKGRRSIDGDFSPKPSFGMYKSIDGGETWFEINTGLNTSFLNINVIAVHPTNPNIVYIGTWRDGIFKTTNGGESWELKSNGLASSDVRSLAIDPQNPNIVYVGLGEGAGVFKSTNGGEIWNQVNNGLSIECPNYLLPLGKVNQNITLEKMPRRLIGSDYYSVPWTSVRSIVIDPTNSQTIFAADYHSGVYISTDGGDTWYAANQMLSTRAVSALAISGDGTILYAATSGGGVFRLTLGRNKPPQILTTIPGTADTVTITHGDSLEFEAFAFDLNKDTLIYNWYFNEQKINNENSSKYLLKTTDKQIGIHYLKLFISDKDTTISVKWTINIQYLTFINDIHDLKILYSFSLSPNYPNPFNSQTKIKYEIPTNSKVTIKIFNLLGQGIITLVDDYKEIGDHEVIWDGKNRNGSLVASGIYIYRIDATSSSKHFVQERKMVLLQ